MKYTVYQDCDSDPMLNTGKWFCYGSINGHIAWQGLAYATEAEAREACEANEKT